jgi:hypothetical protein
MFIMAYRLPNFNILCNIKTAGAGIPPPPPHAPWRIANQPCQLTYGQRVNVASTGGTSVAGVIVVSMSLLLPALTDIRGLQDTVRYDLVEVPAGSGRYYSVSYVDDIAKGFANEHRTAALLAMDGTWTAPYP